MNIEPLDSPSVNLGNTIRMIDHDYTRTIKNEAELQKCINHLNLFYSKENDEKKLGKSITMPPYQYLPENQNFWLENVMPIARQAAATYKLILESYKELYKLELNQLPPPPQFGMSDRQQTPVNVNVNNPEKRSIWPSFGGLRRKPENKVTPFHLEIMPLKDRQHKIQLFYDYIEFHEFKTDWPEFMKFEGLYDLLAVEKVQFFNRMSPVVTIISEGYEMKREYTKAMGTQLVMGSLMLNERHRDLTQI